MRVLRVQFNTDEIAKVLWLDPNQVEEAFRDGRGAWPFSEMWGERLFEFIKHRNSNQPSSDGAVSMLALGDFSISIKALSKNGVKFQQSKYVGVGRQSTRASLIESLEQCERVIVVDITQFPQIDFWPLDGGRLISAAHSGALKTSGWSPTRFYKWAKATYDVRYERLRIDNE
ncbi:MAG: hypothetical protein AAFO61_09910 [Pseudomonadota bacterium]